MRPVSPDYYLVGLRRDSMEDENEVEGGREGHGEPDSMGDSHIYVELKMRLRTHSCLQQDWQSPVCGQLAQEDSSRRRSKRKCALGSCRRIKSSSEGSVGWSEKYSLEGTKTGLHFLNIYKRS